MTLVKVERRTGPRPGRLEGATVYGVGVSSTVSPAVKKQRWREYRVWTGMLNRCYSPSANGYQFYGGAGVYVSPRWLDLSLFLEDLPSLPNYSKWANSRGYNLDKDYYGGQCYDVTTCVFSPRTHNIQYTGIPFEIDGHLFLTSKAAAAYIGVTQKTFRKYRRQGRYSPAKDLIRHSLEDE